MLDSRSAILSAIFLASAATAAHSADMPLDWYPHRDWPRVGRSVASGPTEYMYRGPPLERPAIKKGDRLPLSSSPDGGEGGVTVRPRDARPLVTTPGSGAAPTASAKGAPTDDRGYLIPLLLVILAMIGLLWIIGSLPRLARAVDRFFEPSTGEASADAPVVVQVGDSAAETSAANHENEISAMRAMKEQLEAQAAAARAAIEEALARANKDQKEDAA